MMDLKPGGTKENVKEIENAKMAYNPCYNTLFFTLDSIMKSVWPETFIFCL